jgi:hypothetical protein
VAKQRHRAYADEQKRIEREAKKRRAEAEKLAREDQPKQPLAAPQAATVEPAPYRWGRVGFTRPAKSAAPHRGCPREACSRGVGFMTLAHGRLGRVGRCPTELGEPERASLSNSNFPTRR